MYSNFFENGAWQLEIEAIELVAFTKRYLEIQLTLSYPDYITLSLVEPDTLKIKVMTPEIFIDEKTFTRMEENYEFLVSLPPQMTAEKAQLLKAVEDQVSSPIAIISVITTVG